MCVYADKIPQTNSLHNCVLCNFEARTKTSFTCTVENIRTLNLVVGPSLYRMFMCYFLIIQVWCHNNAMLLSFISKMQKRCIDLKKNLLKFLWCLLTISQIIVFHENRFPRLSKFVPVVNDETRLKVILGNSSELFETSYCLILFKLVTTSWWKLIIDIVNDRENAEWWTFHMRRYFE